MAYKILFFLRLFLVFLSFFFTSVFASPLHIKPTVQSLDQAWSARTHKESQKEILEFVKTVQEVPNDFDVTWRIARLVYFIGNFGIGESLKKPEQMQVFEIGYKTAEVAKTLEPTKVEGHYWYAVNLGKYGLAKGIFSALSRAKDGRDALLIAADIDPTYHWAGPYRILGKYYQDLPGGISFGDKKKAREYYNKALEIAPDFKMNTVYLATLEKDKSVKRQLLQSLQKKPDLDGEVEEIRYKTAIKKDLKKL